MHILIFLVTFKIIFDKSVRKGRIKKVLRVSEHKGKKMVFLFYFFFPILDVIHSPHCLNFYKIIF